MEKYSAEALRATVAANSYRMLDHHDCAICGVMVRYYFGPDGEVEFDPSCGCVSGDNSRPSSYEEIADWLAMQSSDEMRERILSGFR